jgi:hypothetical protein
VDEPFRVNISKARDELIREQEYCLEREFPTAIIEEILQVWAEKLKRHHPVFAFLSMPVYLRDARSTR